MVELVWDVWQWQRLSDIEQQDRLETNSQDADPHQRVKALQQTVERLSLASAAMWSLVKQRTELTDQDLVTRLRRMEGEQAEGKSTAAKCTKCGRTIPPRKARCIYCGEKRETSTVSAAGL